MQTGQSTVKPIAHIPVARAEKRPQGFSIKDYQLITCIGRGGFGRVWRAMSKSTGEIFALKIMKKLKVLNKNGQKSVMNERAILQQIKFE